MVNFPTSVKDRADGLPTATFIAYDPTDGAREVVVQGASWVRVSITGTPSGTPVFQTQTGDAWGGTPLTWRTVGLIDCTDYETVAAVATTANDYLVPVLGVTKVRLNGMSGSAVAVVAISTGGF